MPVTIRTRHSREIAQAMALPEGDIGIVYGSMPHPALNKERIAQGRLVCVSRIEARGADWRTTVALGEVLRSPIIRIDEHDSIDTVLAERWSRLGVAPTGGITVQTHHIALVLAEPDGPPG